MASPRVKKCECCPECKGVIILPANSNEGEELFQNARPAETFECKKGPGEFKGSCRKGMRPPCAKCPVGEEGAFPPPQAPAEEAFEEAPQAE